MPLSESLDADRLRRFRVKVTVLSSFGLFLDGYDLTVIAVALPELKNQWGFSGWLDGLVGSSALVGMLVGAVALGWVTDRLGRKTVYLADLVGFVAFAVCTGLSQNIWQLILFRFLLGLAIGADYPISSSLTAEFSTTRGRAKHLARMSMAYGVGSAVAFVLGGALGGLGENSWRWLLFLGAIFAVVVIVLRGAIPESPLWLRSQGRAEEGERILERLLGQSDAGSEGAEATAAGRPTGPPGGSPGVAHQRWRDLFRSHFRRAVVFVCGFYFFFAVAFYGIQLYTPSIITGLSGASAARADYASAAISLLGVLGQFIGSFLLESWGRRPTVALGFAGQAVLLAVIAVLLKPPFLVIVLFIALAIVLINIGPGVAILLYPSELFPSAVRASAVGLAVATSRVGAVLGVLVFPELVRLWGSAQALWVFVASAVLGLLVCLALAPETKGRVLDS